MVELRKRAGAAAYLLVSAIEPAEGVSEKEVQNFFDEVIVISLRRRPLD
jgi:hypothetical protein